MDAATVQDLVGRWWVSYDAGRFDEWPELFTADAIFTCRTDTGGTAYEDFVRADVQGRDPVLAWQRTHREASPYPLRHHASNVHVTRSGAAEADFCSYLFVTQIAGGVSNLSSAVCHGTIQVEGGQPRLAALHVVLDTEESVVFSERTPRPGASRAG